MIAEVLGVAGFALLVALMALVLHGLRLLWQRFIQ